MFHFFFWPQKFILFIFWKKFSAANQKELKMSDRDSNEQGNDGFDGDPNDFVSNFLLTKPHPSNQT